MLLSMTGFGDSRKQQDGLNVAVEVRTVNNRYFKLFTRFPDAYAALENRIEKLLRESISRGSVTVTVRADRMGIESRYTVNRQVFENYWREIRQLSESFHLPTPGGLSAFLNLPGVISEDEGQLFQPENDWPVIREALQEALQKLQDFRIREGQSMQEDLQSQCQTIDQQVEQVSQLTPQVVEDYRNRLLDRVRELLKDTNVTINDSDLNRDVSIFADRSDINEELTRLRCHLDQFQSFLGQDTSMGRKLEFLTQEMFREVNTIGAKANHVSIAHCVVEMKSAVEKIREILQNVE